MIDKTSLFTTAAQASNPFSKAASAAAKPSGGPSFADLLGDMVSKTSQAQEAASSVFQGVQMNKPNASIEESVIASSKAGLQFQMVVQVRNKVVQAYSDIMNMPV